MLFTGALAVDALWPLHDNDGLAVDAHRPPDILCSNLLMPASRPLITPVVISPTSYNHVCPEPC